MTDTTPGTDAETPVLALRDLVEAFVAERNWHVFHTPKNLASSVAIEAAELMEHFQWLTPEEASAIVHDRDKVAAIGEELADVLCYLFALANVLQLDITQAVRNKMVLNRRKYPPPSRDSRE